MGRTLDQILQDIAEGKDGSLEELRNHLEEAPFEAIRGLLASPNEMVRIEAAKALAAFPDAVEPLAAAVRDDDAWRVRLEAVKTLSRWESREGAAAFLAALAEDDDIDVSRAAAQGLQKQLERAPETLEGVSAPAPLLSSAEERARSLGEGRFQPLLAWLTRLKLSDPAMLARFGTDLTREAEQGRLARAHRIDRSVSTLIDGLVTGRQRSFVVLGQPGSGKTALIHELVHRLKEHPAGPWRVLRVNPSEILAGTVYLGEWQTKVRELIAMLRAAPRLLLYVPNLSELSQAGRSSKNDLNVATMLAPHVEAGEIAVVGESTEEAFRRGLGADPSLRRLFAAVEVAPASAAETRAILTDVRDEAGLEMSDEDLERLAELAGLYLPGTVEPGRAVGLLRRVIETGRTGPVRQRDVLAVLASSTGIPVDFLDDAVPLDLDRVRDFLESRVMGQREAVGSVLDLVTLVKAGLNDPNRPFGVLLFVGPTGVGKTELARALAELLFGDPGRLIRLDMSEYATPDAYERLIGRGDAPGTLTSAVREHPFSVVLLDEIEKAHLNAYDLFLQVFDAGRLTDGAGRTTDFRRTIVILTSNLGAAVRTEASVGFGAGEAVPTAAGTEEILREVQRWFRPEFVNRLDGVIAFKPLGLETAEQIARREVDRVLRRGGLARRGVSVEVEPAVMALLLKEGYSPAYGARPLKRTVARRVLQPLARALARGATRPGSILRLALVGGQVSVDVVAQGTPVGDAASPAPTGSPPPAAGADLGARCAAIQRDAEPLRRRKSELLARSHAPGFWRDAPAARALLDEVHRLEGVVGAAERLASQSVELERLAATGAAQRKAARLEPRREALAREAALVEHLLEGARHGLLSDAFVRLTLLRGEGADLAAVPRLAAMLAGFARRRGLEVTTLDDRRTSEPAADAITLEVVGPGALALFAREEGIHQLSRRGARGAGRPSRAWVRVDVLAVPPETGRDLASDVTVRAKTLKGVKGRRIAKPTLELSLLHAPSLTSLVAHTAGSRDEALARLLPLLAAVRERAQAPAPAAPTASQVVRVYELGSSPRVRDRRTGCDTGHVERVLDGELELLLPA
jgi:ATP-dependent Clp protease ATP-binding subunit ClpC